MIIIGLPRALNLTSKQHISTHSNRQLRAHWTHCTYLDYLTAINTFLNTEGVKRVKNLNVDKCWLKCFENWVHFTLVYTSSGVVFGVNDNSTCYLWGIVCFSLFFLIIGGHLFIFLILSSWDYTIVSQWSTHYFCVFNKQCPCNCGPRDHKNTAKPKMNHTVLRR